MSKPITKNCLKNFFFPGSIFSLPPRSIQGLQNPWQHGKFFCHPLHLEVIIWDNIIWGFARKQHQYMAENLNREISGKECLLKTCCPQFSHPKDLEADFFHLEQEGKDMPRLYVQNVQKQKCTSKKGKQKKIWLNKWLMTKPFKTRFASQKHKQQQKLTSRLEANAVTTSNLLITFIYFMLCKTCL